MPTAGAANLGPVAESAKWIDLLDPDRAALEAACAGVLHPRALDQLLAPAIHGGLPRPTIESHGSYVYGVFLVPVVDHEADLVFYQEVDVIMTADLIVSVRKTPTEGPAFDTSSARARYESAAAHAHRAARVPPGGRHRGALPRHDR